MSLRAALRQSKIEQEKREKEAKEKKNNLKKKATSSNSESNDGNNNNNNNNNNAGKSYFCFECATVIEDGRGRTVVKSVGCEFSGKCENWVCETCAKKSGYVNEKSTWFCARHRNIIKKNISINNNNNKKKKNKSKKKSSSKQNKPKALSSKRNEVKKAMMNKGMDIDNDDDNDDDDDGDNDEIDETDEQAIARNKSYVGRKAKFYYQEDRKWYDIKVRKYNVRKHQHDCMYIVDKSTQPLIIDACIAQGKLKWTDGKITTITMKSKKKVVIKKKSIIKEATSRTKTIQKKRKKTMSKKKDNRFQFDSFGSEEERYEESDSEFDEEEEQEGDNRKKKQLKKKKEINENKPKSKTKNNGTTINAKAKNSINNKKTKSKVMKRKGVKKYEPLPNDSSSSSDDEDNKRPLKRFKHVKRLEHPPPRDGGSSRPTSTSKSSNRRNDSVNSYNKKNKNMSQNKTGNGMWNQKGSTTMNRNNGTTTTTTTRTTTTTNRNNNNKDANKRFEKQLRILKSFSPRKVPSMFKTINESHMLHAVLMDRAGKLLKLPAETRLTCISFYHRMNQYTQIMKHYLSQQDSYYDPMKLAIACVFLGAKATDHQCSLRDTLTTFFRVQIKKTGWNQKKPTISEHLEYLPTKDFMLLDKAYYGRKNEIIKYEQHVLNSLGYHVDPIDSMKKFAIVVELLKIPASDREWKKQALNIFYDMHFSQWICLYASSLERALTAIFVSGYMLVKEIRFNHALSTDAQELYKSRKHVLDVNFLQLVHIENIEQKQIATITEHFNQSQKALLEGRRATTPEYLQNNGVPPVNTNGGFHDNNNSNNAIETTGIARINMELSGGNTNASFNTQPIDNNRNTFQRRNDNGMDNNTNNTTNNTTNNNIKGWGNGNNKNVTSERMNNNNNNINNYNNHTSGWGNQNRQNDGSNRSNNFNINYNNDRNQNNRRPPPPNKFVAKYGSRDANGGSSSDRNYRSNHNDNRGNRFNYERSQQQQPRGNFSNRGGAGGRFSNRGGAWRDRSNNNIEAIDCTERLIDYADVREGSVYVGIAVQSRKNNSFVNIGMRDSSCRENPFKTKDGMLYGHNLSQGTKVHVRVIKKHIKEKYDRGNTISIGCCDLELV